MNRRPDPDAIPDCASVVEAAERMTELAEVAELMGDDDGAAGLRRGAERLRARAMHILDG